MTGIRHARLALAAPLSLLIAAAGPRAIDLPGDRLHPESLSIAPGDRAYVGSLQGGVLRVSLRTGKAEQFIRPGAFGSGPLFGVLADTRNAMLWTCTNDFSSRGFALNIPGVDIGAFVKGFDLRTGAGKVSLKLPGEHPVCNDFAVGKDGSLFVADTGASRILRWRPGTETLEIWAEDPMFQAPGGGGGLDGLAFGADGNLYVNNVRSGDLFRIAVAADGSAGAATKLTLSRPLVSPDGMRPIGGMRFALAEGAGGRVDEVTITGDRAEIRTLAEGISSPTGVDVQGNSVWYVQGQLAYALNPAKRAETPELPFRLTPVPLPK